MFESIWKRRVDKFLETLVSQDISTLLEYEKISFFNRASWATNDPDRPFRIRIS